MSKPQPPRPPLPPFPPSPILPRPLTTTRAQPTSRSRRSCLCQGFVCVCVCVCVRKGLHRPILRLKSKHLYPCVSFPMLTTSTSSLTYSSMFCAVIPPLASMIMCG